MSRSQFNEPYKRTFDHTDPVVFQCKRKVQYPTLEKANTMMMATMARNPGEVFNVYKCHHCLQYHIGHPPKVEPKKPELEVIVKSGAGKVLSAPSTKLFTPKTQVVREELPLIDTTNMGKLLDEFKNTYIFQMPMEMPHTEQNMLSYGVLISVKKATEEYKEPGGAKSPDEKWRAYYNMVPTYARTRGVEFQKLITPHLEQFEDRATSFEAPSSVKLNPVLKGNIILAPKPEPKAAAAPVKAATLKETGETFKGRKIWRDADNRPFVKSNCGCKECGGFINFRAKVSCTPDGAFANIQANKPVDDLKARPVRKNSHDYYCGECAAKHEVGAVEKKKVVVRSAATGEVRVITPGKPAAEVAAVAAAKVKVKAEKVVKPKAPKVPRVAKAPKAPKVPKAPKQPPVIEAELIAAKAAAPPAPAPRGQGNVITVFAAKLPTAARQFVADLETMVLDENVPAERVRGMAWVTMKSLRLSLGGAAA